MTLDLRFAPTSRDFLKSCLELRKAKGLPSSFAYVARVAGFAARSFPRDVVEGCKSLSPQSAAAIASGLKLSADLRDLFIGLTERESAVTPAEKQRSERKLQSIRKRIERKTNAATQSDAAFAVKDFSKFYA